MSEDTVSRLASTALTYLRLCPPSTRHAFSRTVILCDPLRVSHRRLCLPPQHPKYAHADDGGRRQARGALCFLSLSCHQRLTFSLARLPLQARRRSSFVFLRDTRRKPRGCPAGGHRACRRRIEGLCAPVQGENRGQAEQSLGATPARRPGGLHLPLQPCHGEGRAAGEPCASERGAQNPEGRREGLSESCRAVGFCLVLVCLLSFSVSYTSRALSLLIVLYIDMYHSLLERICYSNATLLLIGLMQGYRRVPPKPTCCSSSR